jgi:flagellar hook-associated protein 3 FlgL
MRVTENGMAMNYLTNMNQSRQKIMDLQAQLASGKRVQKPSDDPITTGTIMRLQSALGQNAQYSANIEAGKGIADSTSAALGSLSDVLMSLKQTVITSMNGSAIDSLATSADSVDQFLSEAVNIGNTSFNGKYIFGGTQTLDVPYVLADDGSSVTKNPKGVDGTISFPVGEGINQQVNVTGEEAFQATGIFDMMIQIRDTMKSGSMPTSAQLDAVSQGLNHVLECAGNAGLISQGLDVVSSNLAQQKTQLTEFLSTAQDADVAEASLQLQNDQLMLTAAIQVAAQSLPKTLLDFLR